MDKSIERHHLRAQHQDGGAMVEDPLEWIASHIAAGMGLREEGWSLRTAEEAETWHRREIEWTAEALDGLAAWNPKDVARINTLDWINVYPLPRGHPWRDIRINPLNCHATRIKHLQEIEQEWLADQARPGLTASDAPAAVVMPIAEFNAGGIECEFGYTASSCGPRLQVNFDNIAIHEFADDPILAAGYEYWQSLPAQAGIPDWRDIDPVQMPKQILPNVALLEILDGGADAIFRLAGQEFDENFGVSPKGKTTAELTEGDYRDYMLNHIRVLLDSRQAVYSESAFRWDLGHHLKTQRILMPLSRGQLDVIEMIIKIQTWPKEEMRGLPFCEVIENSANVSNSKPQVIRPNDG